MVPLLFRAGKFRRDLQHKIIHRRNGGVKRFRSRVACPAALRGRYRRASRIEQAPDPVDTNARDARNPSIGNTAPIREKNDPHQS